jgi:cytidylate kinase
MISIAIDGPSGSGKSTISKHLARELNFLNVDTGALYRAVAYFLSANDIDYTNELNVGQCLDKIKIDVKNSNYTQVIFLNGEDITNKIRSNDMSMIASRISAMPEVRKYLLNFQRNLAKSSNVIMDGRDIGTVVLPDADVKIFLTASPEVRAKRRYMQLGGGTDYKEILETLNKRDFNDSHRKTAPLKPAFDAIAFDNSEYSLSETVDMLLKIIKERAPVETK